MERLEFTSAAPYRGLEAAIHLARYALAYDLCKGRRVLDIACGEGYGSRFLHDWGAKEVEGVDVSADAVERANRLFGTDGVRYSVGNAEQVDHIFKGRKFDLIVSIETIEHLQQPALYLKALQELRAPGSTVIITCPNDWWYYPQSNESNEFHIRKYSFQEFIALAEPILGKPDQVGLGTAIAGFVNVPLDSIIVPDADKGQLGMMQSIMKENVFIVPPDDGSRPSPETSSYFIAVWGAAPEANLGGAILPVTMDIFRNGMYASNNDAALQLMEVKKQFSELQVNSTRQLRELRVRQAALRVENEVLRGYNKEMRAEWERMRIESARYCKLRGYVPKSVLTLGRRLLSRIRKARGVR
jgi:2-polyprenyl-3-methyl-5-hydroxy-6-metoxy-1,4-benzoquinol methylase